MRRAAGLGPEASGPGRAELLPTAPEPRGPGFGHRAPHPNVKVSKEIARIGGGIKMWREIREEGSGPNTGVEEANSCIVARGMHPPKGKCEDWSGGNADLKGGGNEDCSAGVRVCIGFQNIYTLNSFCIS